MAAALALMVDVNLEPNEVIWKQLVRGGVEKEGTASSSRNEQQQLSAPRKFSRKLRTQKKKKNTCNGQVSLVQP